jgi:hypothetical protein
MHLALPSNTGMQRTALGARKIVAFLKVRISPTVFPIYWCAAADAQAVGPALLMSIRNLAPLTANLYNRASRMQTLKQTMADISASLPSVTEDTIRAIWSAHQLGPVTHITKPLGCVRNLCFFVNDSLVVRFNTHDYSVKKVL